ncbi:Methyltransferase type 11 [Brevundimonas subvibrioides ATCC 15264]|uniref:Methyltransferase type 11 n=2 Tax=Brevundimonas subvibrioides TaxID=74313 RepID=D9QG55_BRESC|nr:Methyltransferase type 11 [Brevundimonas subvibrioides ATCC 15264]
MPYPPQATPGTEIPTTPDGPLDVGEHGEARPFTGLSEEEVSWAYRVLLSREPESKATIDLQRTNPDMGALRRSLTNTGEFTTLHAQSYAIPIFLVPDAIDGRIEIFEPTLETPTSQMCTASQADEGHYRRFCETAGYPPDELHRKYWEWSFIYRVIEDAGLFGTGARGLVFAVGTEPLPAMFVAQGCDILASDGPQDAKDMWASAGEHSDTVEALFKPGICSLEDMRLHVETRTIDMLDLPDDTGVFDFLWSSCSIEHLGGIQAAGDFVKNAMRMLKPGGLAVHTTEFNLSSNTDTIDGWPTCIFRKTDLEALTRELVDMGHTVRDWNFWPGANGERDAHIDFPPHAPPHLKIGLYQFTATSIGIIIQNAGDRLAPATARPDGPAAPQP